MYGYMYNSPQDELRNAETKLEELITKNVKNKHAKEIFEKMLEFMDMKIAHAIRDVVDRIEKRGEYDPDY